MDRIRVSRVQGEHIPFPSQPEETSKLMRARATQSAFVLLSSLGMLTGCGSAASSYVKSDTTLGRIVVYRNGVAYFERTATVQDDSLKLTVPSDKVDDFLKSLTVVDAKTGQPTPISYPSVDAGGMLDMKVNFPDKGPHQVKLTYVTEAPAWKPSYRLVLDKDGKVGFQAWAVIDNTSGEDWKNVKLGVGSSSAMSFRFNLRDLRVVERETMRAEDLFAVAPPMGGVLSGGGGPRVVGEFSDAAIALNDQRQQAPVTTPRADVAMATASDPMEFAAEKMSRPTTQSAGGASYATKSVHVSQKKAREMEAAAAPPRDAKEIAAQQALDRTVAQLRRSNNTVVVEGYAKDDESDKTGASLGRANRMREQLIRSGLDPNRVVAVGKGQGENSAGGVRIVEGSPVASGSSKTEATATAAADPASAEPIGTSHFDSGVPMSVARGSSAMVSVYKGSTNGDVVYLFDAESARGNSTFAFRAVRFQNPTDSQLEQGPMTVFGEGRFIGEGLSEPIPAKGIAFVPFALDRQIVVEKKEGEHDEIAKILTVQRGVFSTEVKHSKKRTITLTNRSGEKATVYVRHTVAPGYQITSAPKDSEKVGGAQLFRVNIEPHDKAEIAIEEATPIFKSTDVRSPEGLSLVKAYVSSDALKGPVRAQVEELLKLHQEMTTIEERIATMREQMNEYRTRMDELHAQVVTLRAVKTAGPIMASLEKKLDEVSGKVSQATVDIVTLQEKAMIAKIRFQDGVAELSLEKAEPSDSKPAPKVETKRKA